MTVTAHRAARWCAVLLAGLAGPGLLTALPASAATTVTISITADGPQPPSVTAAVGDTVVFRNADATFIHQARSASPNWRFDTGPLAPGARFTVGKLAKPGEYLYEGANLDDFTGRVVVPAPASPRPRSTPSQPRPTGSPPASPQASPSSSPTGGSGSADGPSFSGFGPAGGPVPSPSPAGGPAPDVAPALPAGPPSAAPSAAAPGVIAAPGRLPTPAVARRYGLPAALAAVAAAGVASLLVRLLLAHPAARARGRRPGQGQVLPAE